MHACRVHIARPRPLLPWLQPCTFQLAARLRHTYPITQRRATRVLSPSPLSRGFQTVARERTHRFLSLCALCAALVRPLSELAAPGSPPSLHSSHSLPYHASQDASPRHQSKAPANRIPCSASEGGRCRCSRYEREKRERARNAARDHTLCAPPLSLSLAYIFLEKSTSKRAEWRDMACVCVLYEKRAQRGAIKGKNRKRGRRAANQGGAWARIPSPPFPPSLSRG